MRTVVWSAIGWVLAMSGSIGGAQTVTWLSPLNDTGMRKCINATTNTLNAACFGGDIPAGQDGFYGRDNSYSDTIDGQLGFSFAKICNNGETAGTGNCPPAPQLLQPGSGLLEWGCTKDEVTGLVWEAKTVGGLHDLNQKYTKLENGAATDVSGFLVAVKNQNLCGASDWRLPKVTELQSIVHYGKSGTLQPTVDVRGFPDAVLSRYWTSEGSPAATYFNWFVDFSTGGVSINSGLTSAYAVRLVRGTYSPGAGVVSAAGDEVKDIRTGLIWRRCAEGQTWTGSTCSGYATGYTWDAALTQAKSVAASTRVAWRVPNVKELQTLVKRGTTPAINGSTFPNAHAVYPFSSSAFYLTSTPDASNPAYVWVISFLYGDVTGYGRDKLGAVRLVRGGYY